MIGRCMHEFDMSPGIWYIQKEKERDVSPMLIWPGILYSLEQQKILPPTLSSWWLKKSYLPKQDITYADYHPLYMGVIRFVGSMLHKL